MAKQNEGKIIKVLIGQISLSRSPNVLQSVLGSCVGVCLYDQKQKLGGLAHILLPNSDGRNTGELPGKYANLAIPVFYEAILKHGASEKRIRAKIAGGAHMFANTVGLVKQNIGQLNVEAVTNSLSKLNIPIVSTETGGSSGRKVEFNLTTFELHIENFSSSGTKII
ncbi:MAG: chemotaxis protein CheD [Desulfobacterales bacterium]|nr:chemotaxis protein CheD [Desulfobacterales bacterium]